MTLLRDIIELIKARNEFKRDYRRLETSNLDYQALQRMVEVCNNKQTTIEIKKNDGTVILIRPKQDNDIGYKSFADLYQEKH